MSNDAFGRNQGTSPRGYEQMGEGNLTVQLHMPQALNSRFDSLGIEQDQSLPPYDLRKVYSVDEYDKHCPDSWTRSGFNAEYGCNELSYFAPLTLGRGLWFNMTHLAGHVHDVAIMMSMQGVNPLTSWPIDGVRLEQYRDRCPVHECKLSPDRYCPECKFKLPGQNYLASTTGLSLWLDGFRTKDGTVRQFLITDDVARGVAAQVLGDKRTSSFAFAIFESREPKPQAYRQRRGGGVLESLGPQPESLIRSTRSYDARPKSVEIAAGARIKQDVGIDPKGIDYWNDRPSVILHLNYTDERTFAEIIRAGRRPELEEGPLAGLRVGAGGPVKF